MVAGVLQLREVIESDLPVFFEHQNEPGAARMVAFMSRGPGDREGFMAHWRGILRDATIDKRAILVEGAVAGYIVCFQRDGEWEVGYWLGRAFWGKGVATKALTLYLDENSRRPLHARAASDNVASIRVLEKCGFVHRGRETSFASMRGKDIEEVLMDLR